MSNLVPLAEEVASLLLDRSETIVVAESSTGGLISAALLSVPGASRYFLGGAVVYTKQSRRLLLDIPDATLGAMRPSTEAYALLLARFARKRFSASWSLAETGATGPTGNRYGDAAGHSCLAVAGSSESSITIETRNANRLANMRAFSAAALNLLIQSLTKSDAPS